MESQLKLIEADFDKVLSAGSIKSAMKNSGSKSRDLWQVPIDEIKVIEGLNPRVMNDQYRAHIRMLADSIRSEGFYQECPLGGYVAKEVDEDGIEHQVIFIYSGHSRLAATKLAIKEGAQIERLPVSVSQEGLSMEDINVSIVRGNGGKNLTYYESAIICKRLIRYGMEIEDVATRTGFTIPLVKNRLLLMSAPARLREMVANEEISPTLAIELIKTHGEKVMDAVKDAVEVASTAGKTKVRKTQTAQKPDVFNRAKFVKKAAPKLYEAADLVLKDPGFAGLSQDTRELLEKLLTEIQQGSDAKGQSTDPEQSSSTEGQD
jgi:ParB family transcriptional regulator, chromosome partitioning protein